VVNMAPAVRLAQNCRTRNLSWLWLASTLVQTGFDEQPRQYQADILWGGICRYFFGFRSMNWFLVKQSRHRYWTRMVDTGGDGTLIN
jgi:hypothetical protein